jgi:hypothetical protein
MLKHKINAQILAHLFLFFYLCNRKIKQITIRIPAATDKRHKIMKLTSYTKYYLEQNKEIVLVIANPCGFNDKQIKKLENAGARFDNERGWVVDMNKENYKEICNNLKGFQMECFLMK